MRIVVVLLLIVAALAGGAFVVARRSGGPESGPAPSVAVTPAPPTAPGDPRPAARSGRAVNVDVALKELDLIRPVKMKAVDDFTLPMPDGKTFRLADYHGKVVFLNFWATWCEPCKEEMPAMERLWLRHKDRGFVMVGVSLDSNLKAVPAFVAQHKLTFPIALDPKMDVANTYGVRALPTSFIVDREGKMTALALGPRPWDNDAAHSLVEGLTR
jgi:peroxiredoxin